MSMHNVPRVTPHEFHKVRAELSNHGWTEHQINLAENAFHDNLTEEHSSTWKVGIDRKSAAAHLVYLREHKDVAHLGEHRLDQLASALYRHM